MCLVFVSCWRYETKTKCFPTLLSNFSRTSPLNTYARSRARKSDPFKTQWAESVHRPKCADAQEAKHQPLPTVEVLGWYSIACCKDPGCNQTHTDKAEIKKNNAGWLRWWSSTFAGCWVWGVVSLTPVGTFPLYFCLTPLSRCRFHADSFLFVALLSTSARFICKSWSSSPSGIFSAESEAASLSALLVGCCVVRSLQQLVARR